MAKTMGVLPGHRAVVAGSGPFLLVVADQLARAGVEVVALVEAAPLRALASTLPSLVRTPSLLWQGAKLVMAVRRHRVPLLRGHLVVAAEGDTHLKAVSVSRCDDEWQPVAGEPTRIEADLLAVGYGFVPRIQLASLLGCRLDFVEQVGGWVPVLDDQQESSVANVWVAGESSGVAGALVAELEGRIAGLAMAHRLGAITELKLRPIMRRLKRRRKRLAGFRAAFDEVSSLRRGLFSLPASDTVVCRCEELRRSEVDTAIDAGSKTLRTLKVATRLGMGPCQGRMCWPYMNRYVGWKTGSLPAEVGPLSVRAPIKPVALGELANTRAGLPGEERA
jgi:hydrogen cyanide synthase HcnB